MDEPMRLVEAVAISANTIVAAGTRADAQAAAGSGARRVNLQGRTLMPGLIDPHQHPIPGGIMLTQTIMSATTRIKPKPTCSPR